MRILGIETSCDETAAAVVEVTETRKYGNTETQFTVLSNVVASQIKIHAKTGGVVPEVAARAHLEQILAVIEEALRPLNSKSKTLNPKQTLNPKSQTTLTLNPLPKGEGREEEKNLKSKILNLKSIDAIAVTYGPGLLTSLLVGVETAKTLSYLTGIPLVAVNHLEGHIYANWLGEINPSFTSPYNKGRKGGVNPMAFPALALLVSGGHTELALMRRHLDYKVIGSTRDDAAGECFDKVAKMLNLGYPGGPAIAKLASQSQFPISNFQINQKSKIKNLKSKISFPRHMIDSRDYDFSFSGLKTAVLYWLREHTSQNIKSNASQPPLIIRGGVRELIPALCHEVQNAIVDVLAAKTILAAKEYKVKTVMLGGGVAANQHLRAELGKALKSQLPTTSYLLPPVKYATDNASMIAAARYFHDKAKKFVPWKKLKADANTSL